MVSGTTDCLAALTHSRRHRTGQSVKAITTLRGEDQDIITARLPGANTINDFRNCAIRLHFPIIACYALVGAIYASNQRSYLDD